MCGQPVRGCSQWVGIPADVRPQNSSFKTVPSSKPLRQAVMAQQRRARLWAAIPAAVVRRLLEEP